jgi:hypothetical protein
VLLVGLPTLLGDILEEAIADTTDVVLKGRTDDLHGLDGLVRREQVGVIVFGLDGDRLLDVAAEFLLRNPEICVLSISADGCSLFGLELRAELEVYGEASVPQILRHMRLADVPNTLNQ